MFIHGRNDGDVLVTHAESASRRIPRSKLISLEDTDHLLWLGPNYKKTKEDLLQFLKENPSIVDENFHESSGIVVEIPTSPIDRESVPSLSFSEKRHKKKLEKAQKKLEQVGEDFYDL